MNEQSTIAELQKANKELKAENAKLEERIADLETIIRKLKAKNSPPERPGITRPSFG